MDLTACRFATFGEADYDYWVSRGYMILRRADSRRCKVKKGDRVVMILKGDK